MRITPGRCDAWFEFATKRAVVEAGLKLFIQIQRQVAIRKLRGKVKFPKDYDYKKIREARFGKITSMEIGERVTQGRGTH
jgi:hypothetical protein